MTLLPLLLVPLKLKGDCCNVAVLNASAASVALSPDTSSWR